MAVKRFMPPLNALNIFNLRDPPGSILLFVPYFKTEQDTVTATIFPKGASTVPFLKPFYRQTALLLSPLIVNLCKTPILYEGIILMLLLTHGWINWCLFQNIHKHYCFLCPTHSDAGADLISEMLAS